MTAKELLENDGWDIICNSPFEICNIDGDVASGQAAYYIVSYLRSKQLTDEKLLEKHGWTRYAGTHPFWEHENQSIIYGDIIKIIIEYLRSQQ